MGRWLSYAIYFRFGDRDPRNDIVSSHASVHVIRLDLQDERFIFDVYHITNPQTTMCKKKKLKSNLAIRM